MSDGGFIISPIGIPAPCPFDLDEERPLTPVPRIKDNFSSSGQKLLTPEEYVELIKEPEKLDYQQVVTVDARFSYEYYGGHIVGAKNISTKKDLMKLFKIYNGKKVAFVFYCEFSQDRGTSMMTLFRNIDREVNQYPILSFPDIFLLEGGYSRFYKEFENHCEGGYVRMHDKKFKSSGQLKQENTKFMKEIMRGSQMIQRGRNMELL